ncbi:MAG: lipid A deacylase LpxR family protein, partial [Sphingobacteriaceae bacterium]
MLRSFLLMVCLCFTISVFAQTHSYEFGFQSDNDSFLAAGSDRYYTNGLFVFLRHGLSINPADSAKLKNKVLGFELGQKIFNPRSGSVLSPQLIDRPFAAYLYAGSSLNYLYSNESNLKFSAQIGVVGPDALGKQAQNVIHDTFGFYTLNGWEYQVENSFQLNLAAEYNRLLARTTGADISLNTYGRLGTGFSGAGAGVLIRLGDFNQLFNSVSTQSTAIKNRGFAPLEKREFFFYIKPLLNYVAYDATIEGSLFGKNVNSNSQEVTLTRKPIVFMQQFGISYGGSRW